jgi:MarR family transcriptional regulator for hemolysin
MGQQNSEKDNTSLFAEMFVTTAQAVFQSINLKELNLTSLSLMTMMLIYSHSGITMSELATAVGVSNAQLSRTVSKLEERGLVERRHNDKNRRIVNVFQTVAGQKMAQEQVGIVRANLSQRLANLLPDEREELRTHFLASMSLLAKVGIVKSPNPHEMDEAMFGRKLSGSHPGRPEL